MIKLTDYQLVLFDFDGLLVDTEKLHFASYRELCRRQGYDLNWTFSQFCQAAHGKANGIWEAFGNMFPGFYAKQSKEELYELKKQIYVELLQKSQLELMEGVAPLLRVLEEHNIPRAVVTNSPREHIEIIKHALPLLQTIPLWVTREDYTHPKPDPEGYLTAIAKLGKPKRVIGFEDTLKGLKALLAAGVEGVLVCPKDHVHVQEGLQLGAQHLEKLSKSVFFN